jgi:two-component system response regulator
MNERDVKLLFQADHWQSATVRHSTSDGGWLVAFQEANGNASHTLTLKRGNPRVFKSSDTALYWCRDIGFKKITVELHKPQSETVADSQTPRILLIEDNANDIELTFRAIQRLDGNFDIIVCRDGQEALDFLFATGKYAGRSKNELPQLILLDINLPKVNGHDVLKAIRQNQDSKCIPVVMLTTSDEKSDVEKGYLQGINSYVCKPVDYENFCTTISDISRYWLTTNVPPPC